jgi:hypothetical protein
MFDFADVHAPGSGSEPICPERYKVSVQDGQLTLDRCRVPGAYGRTAVAVEFGGQVSNLSITLLNPSDEDAQLTAPQLVHLSFMQKRNLIGAVLRRPLVGSCTSAFELMLEEGVGQDMAATDIRTGYFQLSFRNQAFPDGSATVIANEENRVAAVDAGGAYVTDHRLVGAEDMPSPVVISMNLSLPAGGVYGAVADPYRWDQICMQSTTAFILFGLAGDTDLNYALRVLRVDGAGAAQCSYEGAALGKFVTQLSLYNAVPSSTVVFGSGVSPFLPRDELRASTPLSFKQTDIFEISQPGEIYVRLFDANFEGTLVPSLRVNMHAQSRNLVGVSRDPDGALQLTSLQTSVDAASNVPDSHFRLLFSSALLGVDEATATFDDTLPFFVFPAGGLRTYDHSLFAEHERGNILKVSMRGVAAAPPADVSAAIQIVLSTMCDGAAYAILLVGTLSDPELMPVAGAADSCEGTAAALDVAESAPLVLVNLQPAAAVQLAWGDSCIKMKRKSVPLAFGQTQHAEVLATQGGLFMRLRQAGAVPPYTWLTAPARLSVATQARNAAVVMALPSAPETDVASIACGEVPQAMPWTLLPVGSGPDIGAGRVRVVLLHALQHAGNASLLHVSARFGWGVDAGSGPPPPPPMALTLAADVSLDLEARGTLYVHYDVTDDGAASTVTAGFFLPELCARTGVLMALAGMLGADGAAPVHAPEVLAVPMSDVSGADCSVTPPFIPEDEPVGNRATLPPVTADNYDLTGMGAGAFDGLVNSGAPQRAGAGPAAAAAGVAVIWLARATKGEK